MLKRRERESEMFVWFTLNLSTSSILAVLPEVTHVWKKEGATLSEKHFIKKKNLIHPRIIIPKKTWPKLYFRKKLKLFFFKLFLPHSKCLWGHVGALCLAVGCDDPEGAKEKNQQVLHHDVEGDVGAVEDGVDDVEDDVGGEWKETWE